MQKLHLDRKYHRAVVVAQLAERSLPTPEVRSCSHQQLLLNQYFLLTVCRKRKRGWERPIKNISYLLRKTQHVWTSLSRALLVNSLCWNGMGCSCNGISLIRDTVKVCRFILLLRVITIQVVSGQSFLSMGQSWPLFVYCHSFLVTISVIQIEKSVDGVLGIWTQAAGW